MSLSREEIAEALVKCGSSALNSGLPSTAKYHELERLANAAYAAGAAAEREAILQMSRDNWYKTQADFDAAIRARGNGGEK